MSEVAVLNREATSDRMETLRFRIGRASGLPPYDDKVAARAWYYTATFDDLSHVDANGTPRRDHGSVGAYVVGDATLVRSKTDRRRRLTYRGHIASWDPRWGAWREAHVREMERTSSSV